MGLLGRRHTHHQVPTQKKLQNSNSSSNNNNNNTLNNAPSQSSLIAAQAAAQLFQNSNNSQTQHQQPQYSGLPQADKRPNAALRRAASVTDAPRSSARAKLPHPNTKKSPLPLKSTNVNTTNSQPNHNAHANIEKLSLNDPIQIEERTRSPTTHVTRGLGSQQDGSQLSATSIQAIASAAAKSAATSTADLLAPPYPHNINRVYPSSPSISLGSSNSVDSAPFSLKPPNFNNSTINRSSSDVASMNNLPGVHLNQQTPKFFFDSDQTGSDYFDGYDRSSIRSSSPGSEHLLTPKYQRGSGGSSSHLHLDTIPSRIDEHEREQDYEFESDPDDYEYDDDEDSEAFYFDSDAPQSQIDFRLENSFLPLNTSSTIVQSERGQPSTRTPRLTRKPPPRDSPPLHDQNMNLTSSSSLSPSANQNYQQHPALNRRNTSPRRKPPPGSPYLHEYDTDSILNSGSVYEDEEGDDPLPQYPLSVEDQERRTRHRHHHGFRKNAKNILKKGIKASTAAANPTTYLANDDEVKPLHNFKTTMRKEKKKTKFNEDKPWKHHNDREYITELERKRYDGVWVANKGLYMSLIDPEYLNQVAAQEHLEENTALKASILSTKSEQQSTMDTNLMLNLVVRDLWSRSRLPPDSLRQIWDLVDTRKDGTIERKSFIIGMWLVDQCLYGRKLPKQLDDSVWNSVSQLGVNVVIKAKKRK